MLGKRDEAALSEPPILQAPSTTNDLSNLSAAGSVSDREPETPNNKPNIGEKRTRKRKRADSKDHSKVERKITEFLKVRFSNGL